MYQFKIGDIVQTYGHRSYCNNLPIGVYAKVVSVDYDAIKVVFNNGETEQVLQPDDLFLVSGTITII